jgi:hypothetical protein
MVAVPRRHRNGGSDAKDVSKIPSRQRQGSGNLLYSSSRRGSGRFSAAMDIFFKYSLQRIWSLLFGSASQLLFTF